MRHLPHVTATPPLESDRSAAVMLCAFRLCDWTSPDTRTLTVDEQDDLVREHLTAQHREQLLVLGRLARTEGLV